MKKIVVILLLMLVISMVPVSAQDSIANFPQNFIRISLLNQDPNPVKPGEFMDIKIRVEALSTKTRTNDFKNLKITLIESYPFTLESGSATTEIGTLKETEAVDTIYRLKVASDAPDGISRIKFKYSSDEFSDVLSSGFIEIDIRSVESALAVTSISTSPESIQPGHKADLNLTLKNAATTSMRDISVMLDLKYAPFTPLETTAEKKIRLLNPGEEAEVHFSLIADTDAESKPYKIPLILNFLDDRDNKFNKNDTLGLLIYSKPELDLNIEDTEVILPGQTGEITISVSNVGPSEIKFISLTVLESPDYEVVSTAKNYMGNLEPDDFQTASFNIHVNKKNPVLKLELTYKDSYNKEFTSQFNLPLKVYNQRTAAKYGLTKANGGIGRLIIYIIVILFIYYVIKGWRRERSIDFGLRYGAKQTIRKIFRFILWFRIKNLKKIPEKLKSLIKE
ncbi:COG1361 S-layer family protein [Candidatus Woesearchaeota archaeon]|nr:COG1361 S-layer family protein [Candidatus Woesearchaeota archaeon]